MCKKVQCPNHASEIKYTWWGCGQHIEQCLADVAKEDRCDCEHEPLPGNPAIQQVKPKST
ncbi:hypothetical protein NliqN6_3711 [Naganishia liquefaciens]|uniref:Uncharacterized protein n=1 Tax=Naganishia liquefaciens TaxID=104408 RepID=A0A8H3YF77_9TREE|nr:hypothetical protein NliqN6_3711 [Naganishia liquefaciens]